MELPLAVHARKSLRKMRRWYLIPVIWFFVAVQMSTSAQSLRPKKNQDRPIVPREIVNHGNAFARRRHVSGGILRYPPIDRTYISYLSRYSDLSACCWYNGVIAGIRRISSISRPCTCTIIRVHIFTDFVDFESMQV